MTQEPAGPQRPKRRSTWGDALLSGLCQGGGLFLLALAATMVAVLAVQAWPALSRLGQWQILSSVNWDPERGVYGSLLFVYGTAATSLIAMLVAVPLGVGTAVYLSEIARPRHRRISAFFLELLAAIPSVVFGFWAVEFLAKRLLGPTYDLFGWEHQSGEGIVAAGLVLAVMILPYLTALSYDACQGVPRSLREGALALGATRWQTIWHVVLPQARPGIVAAGILALGRAAGETMAVTMVIGNAQYFDLSLTATGDSIPSLIAKQLHETTPGEPRRAVLMALGLLLLVLALGMNLGGRWLVQRALRLGSSRGGRLLLPLPAGPLPASPSLPSSVQIAGSPVPASLPVPASPPVGPLAESAPTSPAIPTSPAAPVPSPTRAAPATAPPAPSPSGPDATEVVADQGLTTDQPKEVVAGGLGGAGAVRAARRRDRLMTALLAACQFLTVLPLFLILGYITWQGAREVSWSFFVHLPGDRPPGLAHALVGSAILVLLAAAAAIPLGLLIAVFLSEYPRHPLAGPVRHVSELLAAVPSILIGVFGYALLVTPIWGPRPLGYSAWAGAFALGVMMLPVVVRAAEEALRTVPSSLREAALALGASRWQTILHVLIPAAWPAILTGILLAAGRIAGETAPLILTARGSQFFPRSLADPTPSLPFYVYDFAQKPDEALKRLAWAGAFVLMIIVLLINVSSRLLSRSRSNRGAV